MTKKHPRNVILRDREESRVLKKQIINEQGKHFYYFYARTHRNLSYTIYHNPEILIIFKKVLVFPHS